MPVLENVFFHTVSIKEIHVLIKYEGVANIFNEDIHKSHFWAFSSMSHYFWTWSRRICAFDYVGWKRSKMKKCMKSQLHFWNIILFYFLHHFCTTEYFFKLHNNADVIFKIIQNSIVTENVECFKHLKGCL